MAEYQRFALLDSGTALARSAADALRERYDWVEPAEADLIIAIGGDGYMLQVLHNMLDDNRILPVFGMNRGTVGFLLNEFRLDALVERVARARAFTVNNLSARTSNASGRRWSGGSSRRGRRWSGI